MHRLFPFILKLNALITFKFSKELTISSLTSQATSLDDDNFKKVTLLQKKSCTKVYPDIRVVLTKNKLS